MKIKLTKKELTKEQKLLRQDKMIIEAEKKLKQSKKVDAIKYWENEKRQLESEIFLINNDKL